MGGVGMNFRKVKKCGFIFLTLILLVLAGCQSEAAVKKNVLFTEENEIKNVHTDDSNEEKIKELVLKTFEEEFHVKVDTENLFEYIDLSDQGNWYVSWSTYDEKKFQEANEKLLDMKDSSKEEKEKLTEEIEELRKEYNKSISYWARVDAKSGEIKDIVISNRTKDDGLSEEERKEAEISIKEKAIAIKALEEFSGKKLDISNLIEEISLKGEEWHFYWRNEPDWDAEHTRQIDLSATIDKTDGEVKSIFYRDDISKEYKTNTFPDFDIEEGKKIALEFIKRHGYANMDKIAFLRHWNADPQIVLLHVDFTYGKDEETGKTKVIKVTVDKRTKEIWGMSKSLETEEQLKSKDHERTNKPNPNAVG